LLSGVSGAAAATSACCLLCSLAARASGLAKNASVSSPNRPLSVTTAVRGRTVRGLVFQHLAGSTPLAVEPGVGRARTRQCPRCSRTQSSGCPRNEGQGRTPRSQLLGDLEQNAILRLWPLGSWLAGVRRP
jgi:hypothetical protein